MLKDKKRIFLIMSALLIIIGTVLSSIWIYNKSFINTSTITFEAGDKITAKDFLKKGKSKNISFAKGSKKIDTSILGTYKVKIKSGIFTYNCIAVVEDTIAPTADAVTVYYEPGDKIKAEEFVENIVDATKTAVEYVETPDFNNPSEQSVKVSIIDEGNNSTIIESKKIIRATEKEIVIEAGEQFPGINRFLKIQNSEAKFITDIGSIDTKKIGSYKITINIEDFEYESQLIIKDTIEPKLEVKELIVFDTDTVKPEDFVELAEDVTNLKIEFETQPDLKELGEKRIVIQVTDEGNNTVKKETKLTLVHDTEQPKIEGVKDIVSFIGDEIDYFKGISVSDNHDKELKIDVDSTKVDIWKEGKYIVKYSSSDIVGNKAVVEANVIIVRDTEPPVISGVRNIDCYIGDSVDFAYGITAVDNHDGNINVSIDTSNVNMSTEGNYTIYYSATDKAGNTAKISAQIRLLKDTTPPTFSGIQNIVAVLGGNVDYRSGVIANDNRDGNIPFHVDDRAVNINVCGNYNVIYVASDSSGNTTSVNANVKVVAQLPSSYPYEVRVNKLANCVTVYTQDENTGYYSVPYKAFVCSCGGSNTPEGTFKISNKYEWRALIHNVYGQYASRIYGGILFHSVPYETTRKDSLQIDEFNKLGQTASAGCVRMTVADAKWIFDNCPSGTTVIIYSDSNPGPLGKPTAPVISNNISWDPTDPDPLNPNR